MNRGIVTLNDLTNGLINVNIMEVQIAEYWCCLSIGALTLGYLCLVVNINVYFSLGFMGLLIDVTSQFRHVCKCGVIFKNWVLALLCLL